MAKKYPDETAFAEACERGREAAREPLLGDQETISEQWVPDFRKAEQRVLRLASALFLGEYGQEVRPGSLSLEVYQAVKKLKALGWKPKEESDEQREDDNSGIAFTHLGE